MFETRGEMKRWFYEVVERFREKGAVSHETAMTLEELGLPPRFETAMDKRLGQSGVFVAVNGKYFLSEEKLKQMEKLRSAGGSVLGSKRRILMLRTVQPIVIFLFLVLFVVGFLIQSSELKVISILLLTVWLVISVYLIYYLSRLRKRMHSRTSLYQ